jgi:hypothetical protein
VTAASSTSKNTDEIFTQTGRYRALNPPPGWVAALSILPVQTALGDPRGAAAGPWSVTAPCTTGGLPSEFSYRNLGTNRNKGSSSASTCAVNDAVNVFARLLVSGDAGSRLHISVNLPPEEPRQPRPQLQQNRYLGNVS